MTKRIAFATVCLGAVGAVVGTHPGEFAWAAGEALKAGRGAWGGVESNPLPVAAALGTFLLTVGYHKARGKSLRESVEVAATRVTVVSVPARSEAETAVVHRAKARAVRTQLIADQIGLQNRNRKLPEAVVKAEQEVCYAEHAAAEVGQLLAAKRKAHGEAVAKLDALRKEKADGEAEVAAIEAELKKLADVV